MVLSKAELLNKIYNREIVIDNFDISNVEECSVKLHLSLKLGRIKPQIIDLKNKPTDIVNDYVMDNTGYELKPNEFIIGYTKEVVKVPYNLFALIDTAGSIANIGLQIHLSDSHIDPGSHSNITLQLKNNSLNSIIIYPDIYIAKLYFFQII